MSCSVSERVPENRAGAGGGSACRLRGSSNTSLNTPPNSKGGQGSSAGGPLRPKQCCLCWCCCCSCWEEPNEINTENEDSSNSAIEIVAEEAGERPSVTKNEKDQRSNSGEEKCSTPGKGSDENGPTKNSNNADLPIHDNDPPPTLEEIRNWGRSFDKLMRSPAGRNVFRDFLRCEYSEENILFWLACEDLKRENSPEAVEEKARIIYEDYISILSPKEVSLDSRVREIVNRNMVEPTPQTFDEAQLQIYTLMHRDSYPRFVNSALYKSLAKLTGIESEAPTTTEADGPHG